MVSLRRLLLALGFLTFAACAAGTDVASAQYVSRSAAQADVDSLRRIVERNSAYRLVNGHPFDEHLDGLRRALPESIATRDFWRQVQIAVGRLQDAHSNVRLPESVLPTLVRGNLPFVLTTAGDTIVALDPCRCRLFAAEHPRVVAINDVGIDSLMRIAGVRFAGHSPQRYRFRALQSLAQIEATLDLVGAARDGALAVRLVGPKGDTLIATRTVGRAGGARDETPDASVETKGPVTVLTIRGMSESADEIVRNALENQTFRDSRALLIDVRGNNGGSRHVLRTLVPRLIREPLVYNVALPRVDMGGIGPQTDYALVPPSDPSLTPAGRAALERALSEFRPKWRYPAADFLTRPLGSVLLPADSARRISRRPIVLLIDEGCFSACDIFAGAMRLIPGVTLMGTASAGGSGRSREFVLPNSRLTVILSTMASFQPNGELYDGVGVNPSIVIERAIADLAAGRDTQMEAAMQFLQRTLSAVR